MNRPPARQRTAPRKTQGLRPWQLAFAVLAATACTDPTQLLVVVDSDLQIPDELASVRTTVLDQAGIPMTAHRFNLLDEGVPFSFSVEAKGELIDELVDIRAEGLNADGAVVVDQSALVGFVEEEQRVLSLFLAATCVNRSCPDAQTCRRGTCVNRGVAVETLPIAIPEQEFDRDSGVEPPDAGQGEDATVPDADTGLIDTGIVPDSGIGRDADPADVPIPDSGDQDCFLEPCGAGFHCISPVGRICEGANDGCFCIEDCDPFEDPGNPMNACSNPTNACFWHGVSPSTGICIAGSVGGRTGDPCVDDTSCNVNSNFRCLSAGTSSSACASLCRNAEPNFCPSIDARTECADYGGDIGLCTFPAPNYTDIGNACMVDSDCQSGLCEPNFLFCSARCDGLNACPTGDLCALIDDVAACLKGCTVPADCANPALTCRVDLGNYCWFPCTQDNQCPRGSGGCNQMNGNCL